MITVCGFDPCIVGCAIITVFSAFVAVDRHIVARAQTETIRCLRGSLSLYSREINKLREELAKYQKRCDALEAFTPDESTKDHWNSGPDCHCNK